MKDEEVWRLSIILRKKNTKKRTLLCNCLQEFSPNQQTGFIRACLCFCRKRKQQILVPNLINDFSNLMTI